VPGWVCIDASLALKWVLPEELSFAAAEIRSSWRRDGVDLTAPPLFRAEVTSVIRERAYKREMSVGEADLALELTLQWPIALSSSSPQLQRSALAFAHRFNRPKAYDAQYLALASLLGCELWTGDRRLSNAVSVALPWVRWIGDYRG
jgi:predicted nucleic acid-binding protein